MRKILLTLILGMFLLNFVSAEIREIPAGKQGEIIILTQLCDNCTYVNLTQVIRRGENSAILLAGEFVMTKNGNNFNYSFSDTNGLGKYEYSTCGDLDGIRDCRPVSFEITPTGVTQESISKNPVLLILVILSLIFLVIGAYYRIASFGFIGSILLILSGVYTMIYGFNNYTDLYTRGAAVALIGLGIVVMFVSAYEWLPWGEGGGE